MPFADTVMGDGNNLIREAHTNTTQQAEPCGLVRSSGLGRVAGYTTVPHANPQSSSAAMSSLATDADDL
jgi:hypothetical protein